MIRPLSNYQIKRMAYASKNAGEFLTRLYRYSVPNFDNIYVDMYPIISVNTARYICEIGKTCYKPHSFLLLWLNKGFAADSIIHDNVVVWPKR